MLDAKADKDKATSRGATPMLIAAQNGHLEVERLLLDATADKDKGMNNGTEKGQLKDVPLLVDAETNKAAPESALGGLETSPGIAECVKHLFDLKQIRNHYAESVTPRNPPFPAPSQLERSRSRDSGPALRGRPLRQVFWA